MQVVQPLRQRTVGPLGCSWGSQAERSSLVSLCVVLVSSLGSPSLHQCTRTHPVISLAVLAVLCCAVLRCAALLCPVLIQVIPACTQHTLF